MEITREQRQALHEEWAEATAGKAAYQLTYRQYLEEKLIEARAELEAARKGKA
jgi:hypothetical protein